MVERVEAELVRNGGNAGVRVQQHLEYAVEALGDGVVQWRVALRVLHVGLSAELEQRAHHLDVALVDGDVHGCLVLVIARVDVHAFGIAGEQWVKVIGLVLVESATRAVMLEVGIGCGGLQ